jgi:effector-binding domain-containing protein
MKNMKNMKTLVIAISLVITSTGITLSQQDSSCNAKQKIEIKDIKAQEAIIIRTTATMKEISQKMGENYGKLYNYLGVNKIAPAGAPFAVYYEFDPAGNTTFETGVPVESKIKVAGEIQYKTYPEMKVASTMYTGPYEKMGPIYEKLTNYLKTNNLTSKGVSWEIYLTDPMQEKDTNKYQTIIYFELK